MKAVAIYSATPPTYKLQTKRRSHTKHDLDKNLEEWRKA